VPSRRGLLAALLALSACSGSSSTAPDPVPASIVLSATDVSFSSLLATLDLTATVLSESGAPMAGASVSWSTENGQVASVSPTGRVTASGNGVTRVTAVSGTAEASATVSVEQAPFSITLAPEPVYLDGPLDTATVTATVRDAGGSPIVGAMVVWSSMDEAVATVDADGLVTGLVTGQTTVTGEVATGGTPLAEAVEVNVGGTVLITTTSLPEGLVGSTYDETLSAVGGDWSYAWELVSGSLPGGLELSTDGVISGTPTTVGSSSFTVEATSDGETDTQDLTIDILSSVFLSTSYLVGGYPNTSYSDQIVAATGGDGSYGYTVTGGGLPTGLSLGSTTGVISGIPTASGVYFFEITATSAGQRGSATYAITISTVPASAFNLWISFEGGALPPPNAVDALDAALARWEEIVFGDVGDVTYPSSGLTPATCSLVDASLLNGAFIDDYVVLMAIAPFDGPGGTLARGGPCGYGRASLPAAISGQMQLDEADVSAASPSYLETIVWHEIAHALGIGTLWPDFLSDSGTNDPRFIGTNGNTEWRALGTSFDGVPLEPNIEAHWSEGWFDSEIMTPISEGPFGAAPISRVTIGALIDLGWTADLTMADAYSLPSCADTCTIVAPGPAEPFDIVIVDELKPLPE
jgi:hypothetical protein